MLWLPEQEQLYEKLIFPKNKNAETAVEEQHALCHLLKHQSNNNKEPFSGNIKDWDFTVC